MNVDAKEIESARVFVNSLPDQNYDSKKRDALSYNNIRRISCRARVSFQMFFACTILASKCEWKKPNSTIGPDRDTNEQLTKSFWSLSLFLLLMTFVEKYRSENPG